MSTVYVTEATYKSLSLADTYRKIQGIYHKTKDCALLYQNLVEFDKAKLNLSTEQRILFYRLIKEIRIKTTKEDIEMFKGIVSTVFPDIKIKVTINTGVVPADLILIENAGGVPCKGCTDNSVLI